ncbi:glucose 1-dehydrogenase [Crossiella cryophila]|uniref:NAD(P)-dependent dehydrogenase (Short-subunit alcohol dehydrogenase family) n=1 Tax=Crossiella cryophila TaxID=43355 RepID=A0A7W7CGV2_9PSEU|nr:glucose 1-dehydrogenase [Crossiella cryophila]MBB4679249.1 NAD(P)-dependent dehydrogenase (short-subunit alcohol dehydrogenase family) [Crossiella cryophila]
MALLAGKTAIITGASSGIGAAAAVVFAGHGANVVLADVNADAGAEVAQLVQDGGGQALFVATDVTREAEVAALVRAAVARFGRVDCAFNNAGIDGPVAGLEEHTEENWDLVLGVNLKGVALCMKHEVRQMLAQGGGGAIVNTASVVALMAVDAGIAPYVASKHAVVGLTHTAALEYATRGIRVNAICPGGVRTPLAEHVQQQGAGTDELALAMIPMRRLAEPREIAEPAAWLCSDAASYVTGSTFTVDGGMTTGHPTPLRVPVPEPRS